jgi:UDP-N-acetyl-D-mannosaminouronate:lipid I N-acetyl-D-mannosaminouronosyltransferase
MPDLKPIYTNGVKLYPFSSPEHLLDYMDENKGILVAVNAHKILQATDETREIINHNIGYADGLGAVWAVRQQGQSAVKIPGCELWLNIISKYEHSRTFYLVGGKQHVIDTVVKKLETDFPKARIVGFRNGYLKSEDEREHLLQDIRQKVPDVVFVAMGSPKQELLMQEMQKLHPQAIYQGLGGSFDVYTGNVKRAPKLWVNLGLEWAYRWIREPTLRTKRNLLLFEFLLKLNTNQFNNQ